ncbi:hypothetical protein FF38_10428 [Lucilia cuprina]|uniref:Uncharacterized protein n=1 Tax=Lucilia cuprina TaxID=7375 RepID=A0A0L0CHC4_LUCCU|nr:hypothetical protein FF38_10428 [Lucilia cuprina]
MTIIGPGIYGLIILGFMTSIWWRLFPLPLPFFFAHKGRNNQTTLSHQMPMKKDGCISLIDGANINDEKVSTQVETTGLSATGATATKQTSTSGLQFEYATAGLNFNENDEDAWCSLSRKKMKQTNRIWRPMILEGDSAKDELQDFWDTATLTTKLSGIFEQTFLTHSEAMLTC